MKAGPAEDLQHLRWMSEVVRTSSRVLAEGHLPLVAIVVAGGEEISRARSEDPHVGHAELLAMWRGREAILRATSKGAKVVLYSSLESCVACIGIALQFEIKEIVYGGPAGPDGGSMIVKSLQDQGRLPPHMIGGVCKVDIESLIERFATTQPGAPETTYALALLRGWGRQLPVVVKEIGSSPVSSTPHVMSASFDELYSRYPNYFGPPASADVQSLAARWLPKGARVLDVGCGPGRDSIWLAELGYSVVAVDPSPAAIQQLRQNAKERNLSIESIVSDFAHFSASESSFDCIVLNTTLNHVEVDRTEAFLSKAQQLLKPGGVLFCLVFTTEDPGFSGDGPASDCRHLTLQYFESQSLLRLAQSRGALRIVEYVERLDPDHSHGPLHYHGEAMLVARRV